MKKNEVVLQNTTLKNVLPYLYDKLKEMEEKSLQVAFARWHSFNVYFYGNKVNVDCSLSLTYSENDERTTTAYSVMCFEALQLQTNTVKIKAECHPVNFHSVFDSYWDDIQKDFGIMQSNEKNISNPKNLRVPKRGTTRFKQWHDRWNIVRPLHVSGVQTYKSMLRYIELQYPDLVCSEDILRENILAGEAGLLEPLKTP